MKKLHTILLVLLWAVPAVAGPGQDVLIDTLPLGTSLTAVDVAAATDGTLFALSPGGDEGRTMNIYRSGNGGSSWLLWGQLDSVFADGKVYQARMTITSTGPGQLVVVWVDQRLNSPASWVRVSRASVADAAPTWSRADLYFIFNLDVKNPRIDSIAGGGFQNRVSVVWQEDDDVHFATSEDDGATWSTDVELHSVTTNIFTDDLDLAVDNYGVAHVVWLSRDISSSTITAHYRRAQFGGALIGHWAPSAPLFSGVANSMYEITIAADHGVPGGGVVAATGGSMISDPPTTIYQSFDQGQTWEVTAELDSQTHPSAVWGVSGPVLAAKTFGTPEMGDAWILNTRSGGVWNTEVFVSHPAVGDWGDRPALALDPTRGDAPMLAGFRQLPRDDQYGLWFNAYWRDGVGYGVPDPLHFYDTLDDPIVKPVLIGDMDDDPQLELLIVEEYAPDNHTIRALDPVTGDELFARFGVYPDADVALINVDTDGDLEVVYLTTQGRIEAKNGDGTTVPGYNEDMGITSGRVWISGGRVSGTGWGSVILAHGSSVFRLGPSGNPYAGWPWTAPPQGGEVYGRVGIGDVDFDDETELVVPLTGRVVVLDLDGEVESQFGEGLAAAGTPSLTDFDSDGDLEIVIPRTDGTVHIVHHDGTPVGSAWPYDTGVPGLPSQVALADMAGDDRRDLVFMDAAHGIHVVTPAGVVIMNQDFEVPLGTPVVEPIVAQVGPGEPALIVGASDGKLRVRTRDGSVEGWSRNFGSPILAASAVADIDLDGIVEMVVPTANNLWVLDMGVATNFDLDLWTMSGGNAGRTGMKYDGLDDYSSVVRPVPAGAVVLHSAAPNPFNPATSIRFNLSSDMSSASLRVYDLAGRLVKTLHQGSLPAGDHQIMWRGDDDSGRAVASGVYYARLQADGQVETRSMVLAR